MSGIRSQTIITSMLRNRPRLCDDNFIAFVSEFFELQLVVIIGKKQINSAVKRNQIRRRIKAAFYLLKIFRVRCIILLRKQKTYGWPQILTFVKKLQFRL